MARGLPDAARQALRWKFWRSRVTIARGRYPDVFGWCTGGIRMLRQSAFERLSQKRSRFIPR
jgi:hypothetical protein